MKRKPRIYYTDEQKALMWERWRKGESLQHIAELSNRSHGGSKEFLFGVAGLVQRSAVAQGWCLPYRSEKKSRALWSLGYRFVRSQFLSAEPHLRSVEKSNVMAASHVIEPVQPTSVHGIGQNALSAVNWWRTRHWPVSWRTSCNWNGSLNRLLDGSSTPTQAPRSSKCNTKQSIAACTSRLVVP